MNLKALALSGLLVPVLLPGGAFAGSDGPAISSVLYTEADFARRDQYYYSTFITALNGDYDKNGFLFRMEGLYDTFSYDSKALYGKNTGRAGQGGALLGYHMIRDAIDWAVYAGGEYQSITLKTDDANVRARGNRGGAKVAGEVETENEKWFYGDLYGEYSTAFDTYWLRGRAGAKFGSGPMELRYAIGPEFTLYGDKDSDYQRAGGFVLIPIHMRRDHIVNLVAAGGFQWVSDKVEFCRANHDGGRRGEEGGYANISVNVPF
jgi:hypothetical protein